MESLCSRCFGPYVEGNCDCPRLGLSENALYTDAMPEGTELPGGEFLFGSAIARGGFGITYAGLQQSLHRRVAIKEFFPNELAFRSHDRRTVEAAHVQAEHYFQQGVEDFYTEARQLASLGKKEIPGIVQVISILKAFNSAYIVMEFLEGDTWEGWRKRRGGKIHYVEAYNECQPLFDSLQQLHEHNFIHRDLKPQNIFRTTSKRNVLIDFGAARSLKASQTRSMWTPGYSGLELTYQQHSYTTDNLRQGPWTDVFGMAASLYTMITAAIPLSVDRRITGVPMDTPHELEGESCPLEVSDVIMKGMAPFPKDRYQSIGEFREALEQSIQGEQGSSYSVFEGISSLFSSVEPGQFFLKGLSGEFEGTEIPIDQSGLKVGRGQDVCALILNSDLVSREHLEFQFSEDKQKLYVMDLHSSNGTFLDGIPLPPNQWRELQVGTVLELGGQTNKLPANEVLNRFSVVWTPPQKSSPFRAESPLESAAAAPAPSLNRAGAIVFGGGVLLVLAFVKPAFLIAAGIGLLILLALIQSLRQS